MANERLAKHRVVVLRPILEIEKRGEPISAAIGDAAWELGLAKSHTWSLYRRQRENDACATALDRRGPKRGSKRIAEDVEIIIDESLQRYYLVRERELSSDMARDPCRMRSEGVSTPDPENGQNPSRRYGSARGLPETARGRGGRQGFAARPGRLEISAPLEVVQIDHTLSNAQA